eukprot:jgi/Mesvir1/5459/Mv15513-RA.1
MESKGIARPSSQQPLLRRYGMSEFERLLATSGVGNIKILSLLSFPDLLALRQASIHCKSIVDCLLLEKVEVNDLDMPHDVDVVKLLSFMALRCPKLERIFFCERKKRGMHLSPMFISDWCLWDIGVKSTYLTHLEASGDEVTDRSLRVIARRCLYLCHLALDSCEITDASIDELAVPNPGTLVHLALTGVSARGVSDTSLAGLVHRSPRLTHLDVTQCTHMGSATLRAISERLPVLQAFAMVVNDISDIPPLQLVLARCQKLTDVTLRTAWGNSVSLLLGSLGPQLASLRLQGATITADGDLTRAVRQLGGLQVLELSFCDRVSDEGMRAVADSCPSLTELDVQGTNVTDAGVCEVADRCRMLQVFRGGGMLSNAGVRALAARCNLLRVFDLGWGENQGLVTDAGIAYLASHCTQLEQLRGHGVPGNEGVLALGQHCPALEMLTVYPPEMFRRAVRPMPPAEAPAPAPAPAVTDTALIALARGCPRLQVLVLFDVSAATEDGIRAVVENCHQLRQLGLGALRRGFGSIPLMPAGDRMRQGVVRAAEGDNAPVDNHDGVSNDFNNIIDNMDEDGFGILHPVWSMEVDPVGPDAPHQDPIISANPAAAGPPPVLHSARSFTDTCASLLGRGCAALLQLDVSGQVALTSQGLEAIAAGCRALQEVHVNHCPLVTDEGVVALAAKCRRLEVLGVAGCLALTDASVAAVGQHCRQLRSLALRRDRLIGDASMRSLADGCPRLVSLYVEGCEGVTPAGLEEVGAACLKLKYVKADVEVPVVIKMRV